MIRKISADIPFYEFEIFQQFRGGLRHAVFTRHSDISSPSVVQTVFETNAHPVAFKNQLHGTRIVNVIPAKHVIPAKAGIYQIPDQVGDDNDQVGDDNAKAGIYNGDILITNSTNLPLVIRIADCASILLFDPTKKIIANIHAGWRGLTAKTIHKTIEKLRRRFQAQPENIFAAMSPMLGPCCSRFSQPKKELPRFLHPYILKENMVDLWSIAEGQLRECGVQMDHIENPRICTFCNPKDFYSYRREGDSGRFGTAIMLL